MITELPNQPTSIDPQDTHRVGVIEVSWKVFDHLGISIDTADTQGNLRDNGTFNLIKKALLLPSSYTIHAIFTGAFRRTWLIGVESPDLPPADDYAEAPRLRPTYVKDAYGKGRLTGMFLERGGREPERDVLPENRGKESINERIR